MDKGRDIISRLLAAVKGKAPAAVLAPPEEYGDHLANTSPDAAALNAQVRATLDTRPRFLLKIEGGGQAAKRTRGSFITQSYQDFTEDTGNSEKTDFDYVMHIRAGDTLTPDALYEFAVAAQSEPDMIYCDEDIFEFERTAPVFKPEIREFTLLSYNMVGWPLMLKREVYEGVQPPDRPDDTAQYAYVLGAVKAAGNYIHIKKVLYTRCARENVTDAAAEDIDAYLDERPGEALAGLYPGSFRVNLVPQRRTVGIVILNCDGGDNLRRLLESIEKNTLYRPYSVTVVDYGSRDERLLSYYELMEKHRLARIVRCRGYNFSVLANQGAKFARADSVLFLSRDAEIIAPDWMTALMETLSRGAAAVSGKLVDPAGSLVYTGGVIGIKGWFDSPYRGVKDDISELRKNRLTNTLRTVSCLTRDLMLMDTDNFFNVGGFDESFTNYGADAELSIRLMRRGGECVYDPGCVVRTLGAPLLPKDAQDNDLMRLYDSIRPMLLTGDPNYSPNYDYASLIPRAAKQPYPPITLNPIYK